MVHYADNPNPFAPSQVESNPDANRDVDPGDAWRDGLRVVTPIGGELPPRCVYCNDVGTTRRRADSIWIGLRGIYYLRLHYWICRRHAPWPTIRNAIVLLILVTIGGPLMATTLGAAMPDWVLDALDYLVFPALASLAILARLPGSSIALRLWKGRSQALLGCDNRFLESLPDRPSMTS